MPRKPKQTTVSVAYLLQDTLDYMEDGHGVSKVVAKDFIESLKAAVADHISDGEKVNLFGMLTITPVGIRPKASRMGVNPRTGEPAKIAAQPAKVKVRLRALKPVAEAVPTARSAEGKALVEVAEAKAAAAAKKAKARAKEAAKNA